MRLLLILMAAWVLGTCTSAPPMPPTDFEWTTWSNAAAGYALEIPDVYEPDVEDAGRAVFFRWDGTVPVKVYLSGAEAARNRGLWPGHEPTGEITLGGARGARYDYTHCDGPFCSRIASFVIEWRDEWLALEFRADGELHPVNRHILDSFVLLPGHPTAGD